MSELVWTTDCTRLAKIWYVSLRDGYTFYGYVSSPEDAALYERICESDDTFTITHDEAVTLGTWQHILSIYERMVPDDEPLIQYIEQWFNRYNRTEEEHTYKAIFEIPVTAKNPLEALQKILDQWEEYRQHLTVRIEKE